ncbi:hypothetical protein KAV47_01630, partial [Candidatus Bathyarchaeota archaeon]|nr:hypothetical protein [Candidatus Bathyarchaeota archaeon]
MTGMGEVYVNRRKMQLDVVEGDLVVESGAVEALGPDRLLKVQGDIRCTGDCDFLCSVEANKIESRRGDILVEGGLKAEAVEVKRGSL